MRARFFVDYEFVMPDGTCDTLRVYRDGVLGHPPNDRLYVGFGLPDKLEPIARYSVVCWSQFLTEDRRYSVSILVTDLQAPRRFTSQEEAIGFALDAGWTYESGQRVRRRGQ